MGRRIILFMAVMTLNSMMLNAELLVKSGEKVAFLGDSITRAGWLDQPNGYLHLVQMGLQQSGSEITVIPCGVNGNTSKNMLQRFNKDVVRQSPAWVLISCGVNDVWHGEKGVKIADYKKNITSMVDMARKAGIKVMILTATMILEDPKNEMNSKLSEYNDFLRQLAAERKLPLADLNVDMNKIVADPKTPLNSRHNKLTYDGVHMDSTGNRMMADGILKAFGVPASELVKIQREWMTYPDSTRVGFNFSIPQWRTVEIAAQKAGKSVDDYVRDAALQVASGAGKNN